MKMKNRLYLSVLKRLTEEIPERGEELLDRALDAVDSSSDRVTGFEMKRAIEAHVEPMLKEKLKLYKGLAELGMGVIYLDAVGRVVGFNAAARGLLPECKARVFDLTGELRVETEEVSGRKLKLLTIAAKNDAGGVVGGVCLVSDMTLDLALSEEMNQAYDHFRHFQLAFERSYDVIFLTNADGVLVYVNPAFSKLYEYEEEEVVGKTPRILKSDFLARDYYEQFWEKILSGEMVRTTFHNKTKSGKRVIVESTVSPVLDKNENIISFVAIQRDVTEREQMEQELTAREAQLKMVLDSVKVGITLSDEDGVFSVYNQEMAELTGFSMDEANTTKDYYGVLHPGSHQARDLDFMRQLPEGERLVGEDQIVTKSLEKRDLVVATTVVSRGGKRNFLSAYRDVSDLKKVEAELRSEKEGVEERVRQRTEELTRATEEAEKDAVTTEAILSSVGEGVVAVSRDGNVVFVNGVIEELMGWQEAQVLGRQIEEVLSLYQSEGVLLGAEGYWPRLSLLNGERYVSGGDCLVKVGERYVTVVVISAPVWLKGEVVGGVVTIRDVSHEREVERMKDEFISIASHQLRTPLTALRWISKRLLTKDQETLSEKQREMTQDIFESTLRLIQLVNDLLNVSRIESGRIIVEPVETNLSQMIREVLAELQEPITDRKQVVELSLPEELPLMMVDPKLIRQVYLNLLSNATKYSPEGGVVSVALKIEGEKVVSEIRDRGCGIPAEQQGRVFGKFFRATNVTTKDSDGTGLGLYLVKRVVEALGGVVGFESRENEGSNFWFTLPLTGSVRQEGEVSLTSD